MRSSGGELAGRKIVVTRAMHQSGDLTAALGARGAEVIELPAIEIKPVEDLSALDRALENLESYELLILGSKNAAELVFARGVAIDIPIACVGAKTKSYVESKTTSEVLAPETHRAEALADLVANRLGTLRSSEPKRVLFPRAAEGREVLIASLEKLGVEVDAPAIYRIVPAAPATAETIARIARADAFTFLSGETLRAFLEVVPETEARAMLERAFVAVIGPVAREKAEALSIRVDLVPETATIEALAAALAERLGTHTV